MNLYTTPIPTSAALITIDVQNDFTLAGAPAEIPGTRQIIPSIVRLLQAFRALQKPIVHVVRLYLADGSNVDLCRRAAIEAGEAIVTPGTDGAELVAELRPATTVRLDPNLLLQGKVQPIGDQEFVMHKPRWGAFYRTPLESFLRERGINSLVFCGCNFPNCPRTSIYEASERDFRIAVATDAVSGLHEPGIRELAGIGVLLQDTTKMISWLKKAAS